MISVKAARRLISHRSNRDEDIGAVVCSGNEMPSKGPSNSELLSIANNYELVKVQESNGNYHNTLKPTETKDAYK